MSAGSGDRRLGIFCIRSDMNIDKVVKECFLSYGYKDGTYPITKLEYSLLAEQTRNKYKMSPDEYLAGKGLNIKIEIL